MSLMTFLRANLCAGLAAMSVFAAPDFREPFRPQFHFTPQKNWMNDPNGMVFFQGEYHLFYQYNPFGDRWGHMSWGHAVSRDLLHWEHLPLALPEENGVMIFSGSAVVDWRNTSGLGKDGQPPLVAIYTGHYTQQPLQNQNLAYSNDKGRTWTKYSGNPVLDIGQKDFRDPKVFWHDATAQWVMVVAWPLEHKVRFYASPNLKKWTHLSDFGPAGATKGIWECPDLFPVPVEKDPDQTRWILIVNLNPGGPAGGSGCQYFVGSFDGQRFLLDPSYPRTPSSGEKAPRGTVLADFEGNNFGDWKTSGDACGQGPARPSGGISGFLGRGLVDTFGKGDPEQGALTSPEFRIDGDYISFLIGGGAHPDQAGIALLVEGKPVRSATGNNAPTLDWKSWGVREFRGKPARLEIFDRYSSTDWGHVFVDHIILGDEPAGASASHALWVDYGPDFYAAVTWSDVPKSDGRRLLLGWMSNWEYAQDVPTSPWRSAMTIPRVLSLRRTADGLRLRQEPLGEAAKLRAEPPLKFSGGTPSEAANWLAGHRELPAQLELEMRLEGVSEASALTLTLHAGRNEQVPVRLDARSGQLSIDRKRSGVVGFHKAFPAEHTAPLAVVNGRCTLRLLLDTASLEVFPNDGLSAFTAIIFPEGPSRSFSLTTSDPAAPKVSALTIYRLKSNPQQTNK